MIRKLAAPVFLSECVWSTGTFQMLWNVTTCVREREREGEKTTMLECLAVIDAFFFSGER